jgi:hypothetical protein
MASFSEQAAQEDSRDHAQGRISEQMTARVSARLTLEAATLGRRRLWYSLKRRMLLLARLLHATLIVSFVILICCAYAGVPSDTPSYLWGMSLAIGAVGVLGAFEPVAKALVVKRSLQSGTDESPSRAEKLLTMIVSTACIICALVLNVYSRGYFGLFPSASTSVDYQRWVMVASYFVSECAALRTNTAPASVFDCELARNCIPCAVCLS